MPLNIMKMTRRDGTDRGEFALAALDLCRQYRGQDSVRDARYWWDNASTIAVVVETEPGVTLPSLNAAAEVAKAGFALDDLAQPVGFESYGEARAGADAWERADRPSGA